MKTAIVTDSNSGITQQEAEALGVFVVPMPVLVNDKPFFEGVDLTQEAFYAYLKEGARVFTSQPSPVDVCEYWKTLLKQYDEIVHIPMSSALSETCRSLTVLADREFKNKVYVVNNQRISVTMKQSVLDALSMVKEGKRGREIAQWLTDTKMLSSIYITVDTLTYLKKGGRLTPAVAAIGTLLKIKPVLQIQGGKLDSFAKVRKMSDAKATMTGAIQQDFDGRFKEWVEAGKMALFIAHTECPDAAEQFKDEVSLLFPNVPVTMVDPLSLSVACHIGPGSLAIACAVTR